MFAWLFIKLPSRISVNLVQRLPPFSIESLSCFPFRVFLICFYFIWRRLNIRFCFIFCLLLAFFFWRFSSSLFFYRWLYLRKAFVFAVTFLHFPIKAFLYARHIFSGTSSRELIGNGFLLYCQQIFSPNRCSTCSDEEMVSKRLSNSKPNSTYVHRFVTTKKKKKFALLKTRMKKSLTITAAMIDAMCLDLSPNSSSITQGT